MAREFHTVGVVGLGTMGAGIAEVLARHDRRVIGVEVDATGSSGLGNCSGPPLSGPPTAAKITAAERDRLLERIEIGTDFARLAVADLVIEAVPEHLELKRTVFATVDAIVSPTAVLATNTSTCR